MATAVTTTLTTAVKVGTAVAAAVTAATAVLIKSTTVPVVKAATAVKPHQQPQPQHNEPSQKLSAS